MKNFILKAIAVFTVVVLFFNVAFAQAPVELLCVNEQPNNQIEINWDLTGPICGASFNSFDIYVSNNPDSGFQLLDSVSDEDRRNYLDGSSLSSLGSPLYYYIINRCGYNNSLPSETLDNLRPAFPQIENVTVNDNAVDINWLPSTSPEADAYVIYYDNGAGFTPIDTVPNNNTYTHQEDPTNVNFVFPTPNVKPERYTVSTIDACGEEGTLNSAPHRTMLLNAETMACSNTVFLNWNAYEGWADGIDHYEVYGSVNGGPQNVLNYFVDPNNESYTYINDVPNVNELCFQIKAFRFGDLLESASNDTCISLAAASGNTPEYLYISNVTVLGNGSVDLTYYADNRVYTEAIKYASGSSQDNIDVFASEFVGGTLPASDSYNHPTSETINRALYYRIEVEDSCGTTYNSGTARTIYLQGKPDGNQTNFLNWTGYGNQYGSVNGYEIYRQNPDDSFIAIGSTDAQTVQFSDDVQFVQSNANGQICYKIEATVTMAYPALMRELVTSTSNIVCISQPARISVPNAFAPEGINNVFLPYVLNVDASFYKMIIFNRWGGVVFETNNPSEGWDGTYQGRIAQEGVYMYHFSYAGIDGNEKQKKGSVVLLR